MIGELTDKITKMRDEIQRANNRIATNSGELTTLISAAKLMVVVAAFLSMIIGFAITGAINSGERYIYRMKQKKENPKANSTSFSFKNINYKKIAYNCIDGMRQFEVAWLVITISILSVAGFFAGMNHPKICFKNPGAVSDFYLISALYLVIIGIVATFVFHILFEKIEFRLKKFLKLV